MIDGKSLSAAPGGTAWWASEFLPSDPRETRLRVSRVRDAWKAGDWAAVQLAANSVLDVDPGNTEALVMRLKGAIKSGDTADLIGSAVGAAKADPVYALHASKAVAKNGELAGAAHILSAIRLGGGEPSVEFVEFARRLSDRLLKAGDLAASKGDQAGAERLWSAGARLAPGHAKLRARVAALRTAAIAHARECSVEKNAQDFADSWNRVIVIDPGNVSAYKRLAMGSERCGNYDAAMECWRKLLKLLPDDELAPKRFARAAARAGKAAEGLTELISSGHASGEVLESGRLVQGLRAEVDKALRAGDCVAAYRVVSQLQRVDDPDGWLDSRKHKILRLLRIQAKEALVEANSEAAARLAQMMLVLDDGNVFALTVLVRFFFKIRHYEEARQLAQRLVTIQPASVTHRELLERVLAHMERASVKPELKVAV